MPLAWLPCHPRAAHSSPTCTSSLLSSSPLQKLFVVPADEAQARIPYARVNHNKYMVTERATYIGECPQYRGLNQRREGLGTRSPPAHQTLTLPLFPRDLQLVWELLHRDSRHLPAGDTEWAWWLAQPAGGCFPERLGIPIQP